MRFLMPGGDPTKYNYHLHHGALRVGLEALGHEVVTFGRHPSHRYRDVMPHEVGALLNAVKPDVYLSCEPQLLDPLLWPVRDHAGPGLRIAVVLCDSWHANHGSLGCADHLFYRHRSHVALHSHHDARACWLPLSVDPSRTPRHQDWGTRRSRVYFSGSSPQCMYPARNAAMSALRPAGMLNNSTSMLPIRQVLAVAAKHRVGLACSCVWRIQAAKVLEYAQAGTLSLYDDADCMDGFIPHYIPYNPDGSDVVDAVNEVVQDPRSAARAAENFKFVHEYHTHQRRAEQLVALLTGTGKEPPWTSR